MNDQPEDLILAYLRRLDTSMTESIADVTEVRQRMTILEMQVGHLVAAEASHYAALITRLDRFDLRFDRLERLADTRLDEG